MNTTPDNTAQTWRDLADQLTPRQVERLTEFEQRWELPDDEKVEALLNGAREWAQNNLNDHLIFSHLDKPADATAVYPCTERHPGEGWVREFAGTERTVGGVTVCISGTQSSDDEIERQLTVSVDDLCDGPGGELTPIQTRQLSAALIEAADELERLTA